MQATVCRSLFIFTLIKTKIYTLFYIKIVQKIIGESNKNYPDLKIYKHILPAFNDIVSIQLIKHILVNIFNEILANKK